MTKACKGCTERHPACWGECPKYLEARAKHEKLKQAEAKRIEATCAIKDVQFHGLAKYKKDRRRKP